MKALDMCIANSGDLDKAFFASTIPIIILYTYLSNIITQLSLLKKGKLI
jgi:hypothetical protein